MATFVHISDIHFGQEKRSGEVVVNNDVKDRLVEDAAQELKKLGKYPATGILVTGDIAYGGKFQEYKDAGQWLDKLAAAIGCSKTAVHLIPGNHDVDRKEIGSGLELMLREVGEKGEPLLDKYLADVADRKLLYARFSAYIPFAEGYNCPLDGEGGLAGDKPVALGEGRSLRFIGLNTALTCSKGQKEEGLLLVGEKQRVLPMDPGVELVILAHHPMRWLRDGPDAFKFIKNRARVLITGHEHDPAVTVAPTPDGHSLLVMAAGATVPPSDERLLYTYNLIDFDLGSDKKELLVSVYPRSWADEKKNFEGDDAPLKGQDRVFKLACPNFCIEDPGPGAGPATPSADQTAAEVTVDSPSEESQYAPMDESFALVLLRFFRDLAPGQRIRVLVRLGELPDDWDDELSHAIERQVVDNLAHTGKLNDLSNAIDWVVAHDVTRGE